jgi:hypothetical protein
MGSTFTSQRREPVLRCARHGGTRVGIDTNRSDERGICELLAKVAGRGYSCANGSERAWWPRWMRPQFFRDLTENFDK